MHFYFQPNIVEKKGQERNKKARQKMSHMYNVKPKHMHTPMKCDVLQILYVCIYIYISQSLTEHIITYYNICNNTSLSFQPHMKGETTTLFLHFQLSSSLKSSSLTRTNLFIFQVKRTFNPSNPEKTYFHGCSSLVTGNCQTLISDLPFP
jgi:hypothetical protein